MPHHQMQILFVAFVLFAGLSGLQAATQLTLPQRGAQQSQPAMDAAAVARGRAAFDRICGQCHPHGNQDIGPRLIGLGWPEARVRTQVRHGRRAMKAIPPSKLSDAELNDVIAYLRTIHTVQ